MKTLRKFSQSPKERHIAVYAVFGALAALVFTLAAPAPTAWADNSTCTDCHSARDMFEDYGTRADSLVVTDASLDNSPHAGFACTDCHADLEGFEDFPHPEKLKPAACGNCHEDAMAEFKESRHGEVAAMRPDDPLVPSCGSCHGSHDIRPATDTLSMVHPYNLPHTCANCHTQIAMGKEGGLKRADAYERYIGGVHAERISQGIFTAASCNDCHGYHSIRQASDPKSGVYKFNVPKTCGACHTEVFAKYERGIHGRALSAGITDAPNCSDCHGEHDILAVVNVKSRVNPANQADLVCAKCHNNPELVAKYGLRKGQVSSYQDSYHGLAVQRGSLKAASCASCHGAHDILPDTDPASSISPTNIVKTCQKCHPEANEQFANSYTHEAILGSQHTLKGIISAIYIPLIIVVIGGMAIHNGLILLFYIRKKRQQEKSQVMYERFSSSMVAQHILFASSFIVLVLTGFALKFPHAWWAAPFDWVGLTENVRGTIHRVCAVIMILVSLHHVYFVIAKKRGRTEFWHMIPRLSDATQALQNLRYYLGWSKVKPDFDRYDYTEKAEYWALVWGTLVMVATGFVLWFPTFFTQILPGWIVIVSETIHYFEAWLATLAIVVWHFFFVIFHPDEYPLSTVWMKGQMSEHHMKEKHPAWYRRLKGGQTDGEFKIEDDSQ